MKSRNSRLADIRFKMGAVGVLISLILYFNSPSLVFLGFELFFGFFAGFLLGMLRDGFELKRYKYLLYLILGVSLAVLIFPLFITLFSGSCGLPPHPYTAENIITGAEKQFVYGSCGQRTHPWYYTIN
jgi:hypothetical protein